MPKKKRIDKNLKKKEKKANDESFIDAYFIPRVKSVRFWTRNLKTNEFVFQIKELLIFKCNPTLIVE